MSAGRSCPLSYRYAPSVFRSAASIDTDTLYVVGGLYGNEPALDAVLAMFDAERGRKHLLFNGDFNWFNIDDRRFRRINDTVLSFDAIRGNVETELAQSEAAQGDAGCGCAYPDWVDDAVVQHSNNIMLRLAATAARFPLLQQRLAALPMYKRIDVGGMPLAVVHGDAQSLAGWGFAQEALSDAAHAATLRQWLDAAAVRIFACSHTCLPVLHALSDSEGRRCVVANNGAAGMPNFAGLPHGLLTRIATAPYEGGAATYGTRAGDLFIDALPIRYDNMRWQAEFLTQWPAGSAAHASYWKRISEGPCYRPQQACGTLAKTALEE